MTSYESGLGTLAARAFELLDFTGRPVSEERLVRHVFGLTGTRNPDFWRGQLTRMLAGHDLFTQLPDGCWALAAWTQASDALRSLAYVIVDVETTGLNPRTQSLIEIAALRCEGCRIVDTFTTLVQPGQPIPSFIRRFTGIHDDMVASAPGPEEAVAAFLRFAGSEILVGHNVRFDLNFLGEAARQHLGLAIANESLDTITLGTRLVPGLRRPSLDRLAAALGLSAPTRHRALADAQLTAQVFWRLLERAEAQSIATLERLRTEMGSGTMERRRVSARPAGRTGRALLDPRLRENLPQTPGVYLMKDERGEVIYVGKAKNLRARVSSYYTQPLGYRRKMDGLLETVRNLETIDTGSELQALILEDQLIKRYQPRFNVQQRNYEHYPFIKIDVQNAFPRLYGTREIAADGARYFGPYRSGRAVKTMIALVQRLFPIRTCTHRLSADVVAGSKRDKARPCLRYGMGRCLGPCHGGVTPERYHEVVREVCGFLGGTADELLGRVEAELYRAADNLQFERAALLRDLLREARQVLISQQLLNGAIERNNLLIIYPSSREGHAEVFGIRHGRLQEQRQINARQSQRETRRELRQLCSLLLASKEPPPTIAQHEVDGINIITRWIYRHSDERTFIPLRDKPGTTVTQALTAVVACRENVATMEHVPYST
jgi:DNA polymerase-3 subunit epsilon